MQSEQPLYPKEIIRTSSLIERKYSYSILKYRHSAVLGESLNIAVFVFFQHNKRFDFIYNKKLSRIRSVYPFFSEKIIKNYLNLINRRVHNLQNVFDHFLELEALDQFDSFISSHIFPQDESSLQFSEGKEAFQHNRSNEDVVLYLTETYLLEEEETKKSKDNLLGQRFYNNIKNSLGENLDPQLFRKNYKIKNQTGVEFTFNYAWKNGNFNLVKPLNFDLKEPRFISEKAYRNYGLVVDLEEQVKKRNFNFDFLVGRPKDRNLFKEYEHSVKLLDSLSVLNIIEEDEIEKYSSIAVSALKEKVNLNN